MKEKKEHIKYLKNISSIMRCFFTIFKGYQEPPPPPPEPPPDDPPPEEVPLELLDGLDDIALDADDIVEFIKLQNDVVLNEEYPSYQFGACNEMVSNFLIHLSDTSNT